LHNAIGVFEFSEFLGFSVATMTVHLTFRGQDVNFACINTIRNFRSMAFGCEAAVLSARRLLCFRYRLIVFFRHFLRQSLHEIFYPFKHTFGWKDCNGPVNLGIIPFVLKTKLAVNVNRLMRCGDDPFDGDILSLGNAAGAILVQAIGRAAINSQLRFVHLPVENDLVGGVGQAKIGGVGLGNDRNLNRRPVRLWCGEPGGTRQDRNMGELGNRERGDSPKSNTLNPIIATFCNVDTLI